MENIIRKTINAIDNPIEYLNGSVVCRLAPSEHGIGVFAIKDINPGTRITDNLKGDRIPPIIFELPEHEFKKLERVVRELILDRNLYSKYDRLIHFISPNFDQYLEGFINHSDTPNIDSNHLTTRLVKAGEEITKDYTKIPLSDNEPHFLSKEHFKNICKF